MIWIAELVLKKALNIQQAKLPHVCFNVVPTEIHFIYFCASKAFCGGHLFGIVEAHLNTKRVYLYLLIECI